MNYLIVLALTLATFYPIKATIAEAPIQPTPIGLSKTADTLLVEIFGKKEPFRSIALCESQWRQFDDKGVLHGIEHPADTGYFQINMAVWGDESKKRKLDVDTLEGNIKMAKVIYDIQGLSAWDPSRECWSKYVE